MLLVDSGIWIDHLRNADANLQRELDACAVLGHPLVTGEIAMGSLADRRGVLGLLRNLPQAVRADDAEVLTLVERRQLFSLGLGFVDAHLLASCLLTPAARLWTRDRRLRKAAERLGVADPVGLKTDSIPAGEAGGTAMWVGRMPTSLD